MGMDLYSKRKPRGKENPYYRFNIWGWSRVIDFLSQQGCDTSTFSGDIVDADTCADIADTLDELKKQMHGVIECEMDKLPTFLGKPSGVCVEEGNKIVDVVHSIAERRLAGLTVTLDELNFNDKSETWNEVTALAYYLGFGDFCRACSKLGGFRVC